MNSVQVLDCTLRDGGYCNDWHFGFSNMKKITKSLVDAGVEMIECGFYADDYGDLELKDRSKFTSIKEFADIIPEDRGGKCFLCMINHGECDFTKLPEYDGTSVDGIRVAFHKKDLKASLEECRILKEKGYLVFVQPMISLNYSDEEFLSLIRECNEFLPYAFYIVDSFGVMKEKDMIRLYYMIEHNLDPSIRIGFHSHNNMQLAYSNAQTLLNLQSDRDLVIDSSVYGMGRGAGNLNTELFVEHLNNVAHKSYDIKPLLTVIDEVLDHFYEKQHWGYSLPNYLSAKYNIHPNYANYLDVKQTLTVWDMDQIFSNVDPERGGDYDKDYIESLYEMYMESGSLDEVHLEELKARIAGKTILLIAPGHSIVEEKEKVVAMAAREDVVSIGINFNYDAIDSDLIFLSNLRRFRELDAIYYPKSVVTSNIPAVEVFARVRYKDLLNDHGIVRDNAALLLLKLLISLGAKEVMLAGLDGYADDPEVNYAEPQKGFIFNKDDAREKNRQMSAMLGIFSKEITISFLTNERFITIEG